MWQTTKQPPSPDRLSPRWKTARRSMGKKWRQQRQRPRYHVCEIGFAWLWFWFSWVSYACYMLCKECVKFVPFYLSFFLSKCVKISSKIMSNFKYKFIHSMSKLPRLWKFIKIATCTNGSKYTNDKKNSVKCAIACKGMDVFFAKDLTPSTCPPKIGIKFGFV